MLQLDHTCTIKRKEALGTNGRKQLQTVASDVPCLFLPMSRKAAIENGFDVSNTWDVYFDDGANVKTTDVVVWNGVNYVISGLQPFTGLMMPVNHIHAFATTEGSNVQ